MNKKFPETNTERAELVVASMVFVITVLLIEKIRIILSEDFLGNDLNGWLTRLGYIGLQGYLIDPCVLAGAGLLVMFSTSTTRRARMLGLVTYVMAYIYLVLDLYTFIWVCIKFVSAIGNDPASVSTFLVGPLMGILCSSGAVLLLRAKARNSKTAPDR